MLKSNKSIKTHTHTMPHKRCVILTFPLPRAEAKPPVQATPDPATVPVGTTAHAHTRVSVDSYTTSGRDGEQKPKT